MTRRSDRVAEAIRRLISETVHSKLRDPRIKGVVTITRVEITPDLRFAKIYYSVLGDEKKKSLVARGLDSAKNYIRKYIGDSLELRYTPDILFKFDKKVERSAKIDEILEKIHKEERKNGKNNKGD